MNTVAMILQAVLGLVFLGSGASKVAGAHRQVESFDFLHLPQSFRTFVGCVEIIGALGILVGIALHWLATVAAIWLVAVMLGAMLTHARVRDTIPHFLPPAVLMCVAAIVVALRWSALLARIS